VDFRGCQMRSREVVEHLCGNHNIERIDRKWQGLATSDHVHGVGLKNVTGDVATDATFKERAVRLVSAADIEDGKRLWVRERRVQAVCRGFQQVVLRRTGDLIALDGFLNGSISGFWRKPQRPKRLRNMEICLRSVRRLPCQVLPRPDITLDTIKIYTPHCVRIEGRGEVSHWYCQFRRPDFVLLIHVDGSRQSALKISQT
jgi:hypothetical protein